MSSRRTTTAAAGAVAAWSLWLLGLAPGAAAALADEPAVDVGGSPLPGGGVGSTDPANPTVLEAGLWRDTLGDATTAAGTHQFSYVRTMKDSSVHVGVIAATTDPDGDQVDVTVTGPDDVSCAADSSATSSTWNGPFGAAVVVAPTADDDNGNPCVLSDTLDITVSRSSSSSTTDLPVAIKIVEEGPVLGTGSLEPAAPSPTYRAVTTDAEPEEVAGATSFEEAPLLEASADGVHVTTELTEGEVSLYRVPLTWGQSLTATAELPAISEAQEEALQYVNPQVQLIFVDPVRNSFTDGVGDGTESGTYTTERAEFGIGVPPVRYLNRRATGIATVPGDYWIAVVASSLAADAPRDPVAVPIDLRIAVEGDPEEAPSYAPNVLGPGSEAGPEGYSPEKPFLVGGTDDFAAAASGNPVPPDDGGADGSWWTGRHVAGLGLGAVSLLLCAAGAAGLVRRAR